MIRQAEEKRRRNFGPRHRSTPRHAAYRGGAFKVLCEFSISSRWAASIIAPMGMGNAQGS